jgi:chromosome segregation ATPase
MQDVNSIQQLENLKRELEKEDREIKTLESEIHRKDIDHKKAKDTFDKVDNELKELNTRKNTLVQRRVTLTGQFKDMERRLHDLTSKPTKTPLQF